LVSFEAIWPAWPERTPTAARPSRLLTAFPFNYPKAKLSDLQPDYNFFPKSYQITFTNTQSVVKEN
jgi:hypothetical protein